jgi:hypothetical protein
VDTSTLKHTIATDLPGRYPVTSARGHKYIFAMYGYDSNYIHTVPIKSQRSCDLISAFQTCYSLLTDNGFTGKIVRLDNEISATMIKHIQSEHLEYQLASPGDHRVNYAEGAIQTYKNHFLSTFHGTDPEFPANCWDLLMPQINITLNLLRKSWYHPNLSAYSQIHGVYDYNKTPMAPAGCKIIIHDRSEERKSWDPHGTHGFYIGPAMQHYSNYKCYIPSTRATRISNTIMFFPHCCENPIPSPADQLHMALQDLTAALSQPIPPMLNASPNAPIRTLQRLLGPTKKRVGSKQNNKPDEQTHTHPKDNQNHKLRTGL